MSPSAQIPARNDFIDYLKGVLIFLVVCGHTIEYPAPPGDTAFYEDPLFKAIYIFHMPLFMAVSGFVSFYGIYSSDFLFCVQKRIRQLVVPAICWPLLNLLCALLVFALLQQSLAGGFHAFKHWIPSFRPGLWFLWAVFGSMATVAALRKFKLDRLEFFAITTVAFLFLPDGGDIYLFKFTFPFFCLGYALAKKDQIHLPSKIHPLLATTIFALSILCYVLWTRDTYVYVTRMHPAVNNLYNIALRWFAGAVVSAAFILLMRAVYRFSSSTILINWGRRSLDIYVIHSWFFFGLNFLDRPALHAWWFSFLAAPFFAGLICFVAYECGQGLSHIPITRTLLLGQSRKS